MKYAFFIFAICTFALGLSAQSNAPVRLAIVSETDEAAVAADVLTANLSNKKNLQLLERNEIEKVYREQGLSAGNKDYLKLGQLLGADGLLLLDVVRTPQATNLMARLIAVKPGVILTDGSFAWPLKDTTQWSESVSSYLNLLLPKLSVQAKDAIPISVVNLRSAIASAEGAEMERQLKLLMIQRLSQEKELFVLERQKMQLLSGEKELKADDSAFWNGSYLLEGVVDQNGYSKDTVSINARLTPPKGGVPLLFQVSGSRTNPVEVINQLALKVNKALKIKLGIKEWNAADEAAQYFAEAQWALRWGAYAEAQAAADSAWVLRKQDLACAIVRIKSYEGSLKTPAIAEEGSIDSAISFSMEKEDRTYLIKTIKKINETYPTAHFCTNKTGINYIAFGELPDPQMIDRATHALELYYEFSRTSPDGEPKILSRGEGWNDWHNSEWYELGIEDLTAASKILLSFSLAPESQKAAAEKLADLRAMTRSVAELISQSPSIHDSYFVGDRLVTHDELANTIGEDGGRNPNIFYCKLRWGSLWQETPEACIALYHELMSSPVFCYIHQTFWSHRLQSPLTVSAIDHGLEPARLVAWNETGQQRIPSVWGGFVQELEVSSNVLLQLEAKAIKFADAGDKKEMGETFTNFFDAFFANHDVLLTNNVEVLYLNWRADDLIGMTRGIGADSMSTPDSLRRQFYSEFRPKLEAMDQEYWNKTIPARRTALAFEKQKQYLASFTSYDFQTFEKTFASRNFTKAQAAELLPLIAAYKSNLLTQASSRQEKFKAESDAHWITFSFERVVNEILNPPAPRPAAVTHKIPQPVMIAKVVAPVPAITNSSEIVTNVLTVNKFLELPLDGLPGDKISDVTMTAHHWFEGKLLLDFQYRAFLYSFDAKGNWQQTRSVTFPAIAILDPVAEHWDVFGCPAMNMPEPINSYHSSTLWRGQLFNSDGGQIKKYDFAGHRWQVLPVSDGINYELFNVNDHLYAANPNMIFEIIEGGKSTRILASSRRNPPVSKLDTEDLGTPTLFEGPDHSLRVCTKSKVFTWIGDDWREDGAAPPFSFQPEVFAGGALFRQSEGGYSKPDSLAFLATETNAAKLWLSQKIQSPYQVNFNNFSRTSEHKVKDPEPLWKMPAGLALPNLPAAAYGSDLYLLMDHSEIQNIVNEQQHVIIGKKILPKDGYHAALFCFSHDLLSPQKVFLKFEDPDGWPPVTGMDPHSRPAFPAMSPTWMLLTSNLMVFGGGNMDAAYKAGVWLMPVSKIEPVIAEQKKNQLVQNAQAAAQAIAVLEQAKKEKEQARENVLAKYDHNHNGIIDPDEKEAALDDPAFIESELKVIDANHNGRLDAVELIYFDADNNKTLEPKEQAGIEIAQHLLAESLLKKYDANGDGALDPLEFSDLVQSVPDANPQLMSGFPVPSTDEDHDGKIELAELEGFLNQHLHSEIRVRGAMGTAYFRQAIADPGKKVDARQLFKTYVELYWQNSTAAHKELSDEERHRILQQLMQKRNAETSP